MKTTKYSILLLVLGSILLTNCEPRKRDSFPGYAQAQFTYISSSYSGTLRRINVNPGDKIREGQALFTLDPDPEKIELQAAKARVQQAIDEKASHEANLMLQKTNNERNELLFKKKVISQEELDQSKDDLRSATASKQAAEANLLAQEANQNKANWVLQQKTVTSPMNALVFDTYYSEHETVMEGKPVLSLLAPDSIKIIFFIPEPLMNTIKLNQQIYVFRDSSQQPIRARITYISSKEEYTPPVIFSEAERQRLVFRVEARPIVEDRNLKIYPGQPVSIKLDANNHSKR